MMPPTDDCTLILRDQQTALQALVDESQDASQHRAAFAQESRDAHASTAAAVQRADAKLSELAAALTTSRVEQAGAVSAAQAGLAAVERANATLVRLVYVGGAVLVALTASLLYATLTLRGVDADAAMSAGRKFASPDTTSEHQPPAAEADNGQ